MDAIFGSKLYKTSSRKTKIAAAMKNPINAELIKQLRKYLDPEYLKPEYLGESPKKVEPPEETKETEVVFDESSPRPSSAPSFSSVPSFSDSDNESDTSETTETIETEDVEMKEDESSDETEDVIYDEETQSVEESTSLSDLASVTACQDIDSEVIKGTLNGREDCSGVARIAIKNNDTELWIYYKDSVNLNSVMESVIQFLENAGYTQLMFSRLARTDNAIVFDIVH